MSRVCGDDPNSNFSESVFVTYEDYNEYVHKVIDVITLLPQDLKDINFKGAKFVNMDLKGRDFKNTNLENAIFENTNLQGADFRNANLENVDFGQSNLSEAIF